jgi:DNA-binding MarR family transcriptional regulator
MASRTARPRRAPRDDAHPVAEPLHRSALHLLRLVRREDAATGLSPARLSALSVLVFGGSCSLGALAAAEGVSAPTMSRLVSGLERDGWVTRRPDTTDARAARLEASASARRLLRDGRARRLDALGAGLRTLTRAEQRALADALPALEHLVRVMATGAIPAPARAARRRFD